METVAVAEPVPEPAVVPAPVDIQEAVAEKVVEEVIPEKIATEELATPAPAVIAEEKVSLSCENND